MRVRSEARCSCFRLTARRRWFYSDAAVRSRPTFRIGLFLILANLSCTWAQESLPVLRGIVVTHSGEGRAYFEDPTTGVLGAYTVGDVVGGNRVEEIRDDLVVLRRGDELVRVTWGPSASSVAPSQGTVATESEQPPASTQRVSTQPVMPVYRPDPAGGPTIGNGQAYLDRLGIPPQALSRAIEEAVPAQEADSDNLKD